MVAVKFWWIRFMVRRPMESAVISPSGSSERIVTALDSAAMSAAEAFFSAAARAFIRSSAQKRLTAVGRLVARYAAVWPTFARSSSRAGVFPSAKRGWIPRQTP